MGLSFRGLTHADTSIPNFVFETSLKDELLVKNINLAAIKNSAFKDIS